MAQIADMIARNLSMMLIDPGLVRDPRIHDVTITEVVVSRDIGNAKVYFLVSDGVDSVEVAQCLNKAASYFRRALADKLVLRVIPRLHFIYDTSIDRAAQIQRLIDAAEPKDLSNEESEEK
jgi:ribosome-binding factor A